MPTHTSFKTMVKFKKGIIDINIEDLIPTIKAIMPGNNEINVKGVKALWASLKVLDRLAIAIHKPLIKKE